MPFIVFGHAEAADVIVPTQAQGNVAATDIQTDNIDARQKIKVKNIETKSAVEKQRADKITERVINTAGIKKDVVKNADTRAAIDEKKAEVKNTIEEKRAEINAKRDEQRKIQLEKRDQRILAYVERIIVRLNAALDRMEKLADRLESRFEKLAADKKVDLTAPKALLEKARASIADGRAVIVNAKEQATTALSGENAKEAFRTVKDTLSIAEKAVKDAHRALVDAISATKAAMSTVSSDSKEKDAAKIEKSETTSAPAPSTNTTE